MTASSGKISSEYRRNIDRLMWIAALAHLLLCLAVGLNGSWRIALAYTLTAVPLAWAVTRLKPGTFLSGVVMAALFMGFSALLIEQTGGMIEAHFSIFIMLSALILYCDWRVIGAGAGIIAVHHVIFTYLQYRGVVHLYDHVTAMHGDVRLLLTCLAMHAGAVVGHALVLGYLARYLRQVVTDSLDITAFAHKAAQGALNMRFAPGRRNRPAIQAVASMQSRLSGVLGDARHAADGVRALSAETAEAQQALHVQARRSGEQIERIAVSTEQLSTTTRESAAEAERTNQLATQAGHTVEESAQSLGRLNDTMSHIDEGARDIANLLSEIDDITFQTNLLALNASVEAARAGDQGRGFAVVANEVRGLSQRSATTAQAIRARVKRSNEQVEAGVRQVRVAAEHMENVVAVCRQVRRRMDEINSSSQQQHLGVETLNAGILEIQQALSLSSESIERTRDVAARLSGEADDLARAIGYFELDVPARERRHRPRPARIAATESLKQGIMPA